ncbi:MAG: RNA methyltransferase [Myxococcales bacterium]|nr:RNA methyltransferase [Myxococcales bacterium]MCB9708643.1 RNA methyltransferase [Myxococcales bacterium]
MTRSRVYIALVHHPVLDRAGNVVTTAVTNLDVHDFSRLARSYGLGGFLLITPILAQRELVEHLLTHWRHGRGKDRVPKRAVALWTCTVLGSIQDAQAHIRRACGGAPRIWATGARRRECARIIDYAEAGEAIREAVEPTLILYGTGHGLADTAFEVSDSVLAPLREHSDYNHLSVRTAAAISLDRLFGES